MRHRNHSKRLGKKADQSRSILRNLATSIILYERVRTTKKRAQVIRGLIDQIITIGKKERIDLAIRRMQPLLSDKNASRKVLEVLKQRYANRTSGFTRIVPVGARHGDGASLADIILIDAAEPSVVAAEASKEKPAKKTIKKS
ncbi:MAG: 50S ribosomal protein L17 [Candidatus Peribacteraceae bacterium]|nr:50S ribosomal protein L17 [Candidatus Peribacteraceae bacterium]